MQAIIDIAVITGTSVIVAIGAYIAVLTTPVDQAAEINSMLLPLIGAIISTGGMILFNPDLESRSRIMGRAIFGLMTGVFSPGLFGLTHPFIEQLMQHIYCSVPVAALGAMLGFAVSRPLANKFIARSGSYADVIADKVQKKIEETKF